MLSLILAQVTFIYCLCVSSRMYPPIISLPPDHVLLVSLASPLYKNYDNICQCIIINLLFIILFILQCMHMATVNYISVALLPQHVIAQPITAIGCVVQGRRPIAEWYNMQAISCMLPVDCVHSSMSVYITVLILRMVCQWCKQPCGPAPPWGECCRQWWGPWENDGDTRPARDCSALPDDNYLAGSEKQKFDWQLQSELRKCTTNYL